MKATFTCVSRNDWLINKVKESFCWWNYDTFCLVRFTLRGGMKMTVWLILFLFKTPLETTVFIKKHHKMSKNIRTSKEESLSCPTSSIWGLINFWFLMKDHFILFPLNKSKMDRETVLTKILIRKYEKKSQHCSNVRSTK